jgi:hypothetical protein
MSRREFRGVIFGGRPGFAVVAVVSVVVADSAGANMSLWRAPLLRFGGIATVAL